MLAVGDPVPEFELPASTGEVVSPGALRGRPWVVYFYPKDDTPGCTIETREFGRALADFDAAGVRVFGCSVGDVAAKKRFAATCDADALPLLADPDRWRGRRIALMCSGGNVSPDQLRALLAGDA